MVIIAQRDEAEGLKRPIVSRANWHQHFGHSSDRSRLSLKSDFDKVTLCQRAGES